MRLARTLALQKIPPMEGERPREPHPRRPVWAFNGDGKRIAGIRKCATAIIIARNGCMCGIIPCARSWLKRPTNGRSRENCMRYNGNRRLRCGLRGRYWVLGIGYLVFGETRENFLNSTGSRGRSPSSVFLQCATCQATPAMQMTPRRPRRHQPSTINHQPAQKRRRG